MLFELNIRNFAIIEKATIRFSEGLNIISGETGSGKSLVSDAIMAVIGGRLSKEDIRFGADKLIVEAQFVEKTNELPDFIMENGIDIEEDGTIVVSREYNHSGKSVCRVNGRIVTLSFLKEISSRLIDLIGQHDHQKLMSSEKHMELLDSLGGAGLEKLKIEVGLLYSEIVKLEGEEKEFLNSPEERARAIDLLLFQISEIQDSKFFQTEEDDLKKKKLLMMNAEKISTNIGNAFSTIYEGEKGYGVRDSLADAVKSLDNVSEYDPGVVAFKETFNEALALLDDLKYTLRNHRDDLNFDINELNEIEKRLDLWSLMKRKYGKTYQEIMTFFDKASKKYNDLTTAEELLDIIIKKKLKKMSMYKELASELSEFRKKTAAELKRKVEIELENLNMKGSIFEISVKKDLDRISPNGIDDVAFLLSANPGEPLKPLDKVASGGEISRVMLALKTSTHEAFKTSTMIFDEIDAGIGGKTALLVGDKIKEVANESQVICITHLAQIASLPGNHIKVEKRFEENRTVADIVHIDGQEKIKELARMLNGDDISEDSLNAAGVMIDSRN